MDVSAILWILLTVLIISAIAMVVVVLMQDSKSSGLGSAFGGNTDSFFGRNKSKTKEGRLVKWTQILAGILGGLSIAVTIILRLMS